MSDKHFTFYKASELWEKIGCKSEEDFIKTHMDPCFEYLKPTGYCDIECEFTNSEEGLYISLLIWQLIVFNHYAVPIF